MTSSLGSPLPPFEYFPLQPSPISPRRRRTSASRSPTSFSFRVITPRQSITADQLSQFSSNVTSDDESHFVLPDLDLTDAPSPLVDPDPPTFSKVVKKAAVQTLSAFSRRDAALKPLCDRIYTRFFQTFDDWNLKQTRKNKRLQFTKPQIDDRLIAEIRRKFDDLKGEVRVWEKADAAVSPLMADPPPVGKPVEPVAVDVRVLEDLICETDRIARRIGTAYSDGQELDLTGQELAERMRAIAEASPALR
jgi:hypothetical protein